MCYSSQQEEFPGYCNYVITTEIYFCPIILLGFPELEEESLTCDLPADMQYSFPLLITADAGEMTTIHLDFSN